MSLCSEAHSQSFELTSNENEIKTARELSVTSAEYTILFSHFNPEQLSKIRSFMRLYSNYESDTTINQSSLVTEVLYASSANKEMLLNNIRKTSEHLGLRILLRTANQHIDVRFIKALPKSLPYKQW
jgi:hypothetical protein